MAAVMMAVDDEPAVTVKEFVSWIVIVGCELSCPPLVAVAVGRLVASFVAADAVTVTVVVATVNEPAEYVIVYGPAAPVIPRLVNVAIPAEAVAVVVPVKVKPADPAVIAALIIAVEDEPVVTVDELEF